MHRLFAWLLGVTAAALIASPASAQDNLRTRKIGGTTYVDGTLNGESGVRTVRKIGGTTYYDLNVGGENMSWSDRSINTGAGSHTYRSDGSTTTRRQIGTQTYTNIYTPSQLPTTYTSRQIGNTLYINGSNGCQSTARVVAGQVLIDGNCQ